MAMKEPQIDKLLQQLADEPASDRQDPWPSIRARAAQGRGQRRLSPVSVRRLSWACAAAAAVLLLAVGGAAIFDTARPRSATAAEILDRMQIEAQGVVMMSDPMAADCQAPPVNPNEMTDRVGQILGVSGDRVRQAMRMQVFDYRVQGQVFDYRRQGQVFDYRAPGAGASSSAPGSPGSTFNIEVAPRSAGSTFNIEVGGAGPVADPVNRIAEHLGLSKEQVQQVFSDPSCPDRFMIPFPSAHTNEWYRTAAQRLGVTPERLAGAVRATAPAPPGMERAPVSADERIARIASELGVTPEQFRSALQQAGASFGAGGSSLFAPR
jgi:hypothetical protein